MKERLAIAGRKSDECGYATIDMSMDFCPRCGGGLTDWQFEPEGVVWSTTVAHVSVRGIEPPFGLAYVDFVEGMRVLARFDPSVGTLHVDDRVSISTSSEGVLFAEGHAR